ncbi:hypothetical protein GE061_010484 [Apolygus lucorum]|uniref:Peptidase S1 domain-containing protein n=1 Tax=Apolygus lucorum TaxID=248454 RepID=A0A8S9XYS8_APOLU|nr:hypothetical protein GE061_010484 [Apolygus lucorum]
MFSAVNFVLISSIFFTDVALCSRNPRHIIMGKDDFPYICSVAYKEDFVFICSIVRRDVVIVSVSNMNQPIKAGKEARYYNDIGSLTVIGGSPYMNPTQFEHLPHGAQEVNVTGFYTGTVAITTDNDTDADLTKYLKFGVFESVPKINVGFLKTSFFDWKDNQIFPLPLGIKPRFLSFESENFISNLEHPLFEVKACQIAGWHRRTARKIFHHVIYVPKHLCRVAYCDFNINTCFNFLLEDSPEVCFKSTHWGGPCAKDTGSVLFCKHFSGGNIFAVLTIAVNCEKENIPCVYTTIDQTIKDFQTSFGEYTPST